MKEDNLLIIGPYPPPEHGTSVPFKLFTNYIKSFCSYKNLRIINTQSGDKSGLTIYSYKVFIPGAKILWQILTSSPTCNKVIIFGSARFVSAIGFFVIPFLKILLRKKVYIRIFGGYFDLFFNQLSPFIRSLIIKVFRKTDKIILETNYLYQKFSNIFPNNLASCPNYRLNLNAEIKITSAPKDLIRFIYIGDIRAEKGIKELLVALKELTQENNNIKISLDLYGPVMENVKTDFYYFLKQKYQDLLLNYQPKISYLQYTKLLSSYDALILPTYFKGEGHSGALIDAMMVGLPVITTNFRSLPEIIIDNYNGFLCEAKNINSLKNAILKFIKLSTAELTVIRQNALKTFETFDADKLLPRLAKEMNLKLKNL